MERIKRVCAACLAAVLLCFSLPASAEEEKEAAWKQFSAGWFHTLGLKEDGTLWSWGTNRFQQLGTGDKVSYYLPQKVLEDVTWAEAGESLSLALKVDGSLWVWGENDLGQLGLGEDVTEAPTPQKLMDGVARVWTNYTHSFALKTDGTLWGWGDNSTGQLGQGNLNGYSEPVKVMDGVKSAAAGCFHSAAIKTDGSLWVWGSNENGQLGLDNEEQENEGNVYTTPVKLMDHMEKAALSERFSCAVTETGDLYVWGDNSEGQLATGDTEPVLSPRKVGVGVQDVQAGHTHIVVLSASGDVFTCGNNFHGQLGDATSFDASSLTQVLQNVSAISAHCDHTFAMGKDGVYQWGANYYGQFGNGTGMDFFSPQKFTGDRLSTPEELEEKPDLSGMESTFAAGSAHNLAVLENGDLWVWGYNENGQTGVGLAGGQTEPGKILSNIKCVAAGEASSYAVDNDGVLYAWGDNSKGQLGLGNETNAPSPEKVMEDVAGVACGDYHALAVKTDGTLWAWGDNSKGQLGTGDMLSSSSPVQVMEGVRKAAAGALHSMALRADGSLWVWGDCDYGQLGFSSDTGSCIPLKLRDSDISDLDARGVFSAALTESGSLYMWGDNSSGQIGDYEDDTEEEADKFSTEPEVNGDSSDVSQQGMTSLYSPVKVMTKVHGFSLGMYHSLAVKTDGTLWAWGMGTSGQLGEDTESSKEPRQLAERVVEAAGGGMHTLFLKADGTLWGVGYNASGQLGYTLPEDAANEDALVPEPVKILDGVKLSAAARDFRDTELKITFGQWVASVPVTVWVIAGGGLLILVLLIWVIFSQRRIRKLRRAAATAVSQVQQLQKEQDRLLASKGTQRRRRKDE